MIHIVDTSSCSANWGICMKDARCQDRSCEGHPCQVSPGQPSLACSVCAPGPCPTPTACQQPEEIAEAPVRWPDLFSGREGRARAIGAALGIAGLILLFDATVRHLFT